MEHRILLAISLLAVILFACGEDVEQVKQEAEAAKAQVQEVSAELQEAQAKAQAALTELQEQGTALNSCLQKIDKQDNQTKALIDSLGNELSEANAQLEECESKDDVIADAARRLCCMRRVDNPEIDSFSIEGDKIVCKEGGETEIDC